MCFWIILDGLDELKEGTGRGAGGTRGGVVVGSTYKRKKYLYTRKNKNKNTAKTNKNQNRAKTKRDLSQRSNP